MKLKQFAYGFSIVASALLLTTSCKKEDPVKQREPDKEFTSAVDAVFLEEMVNDIVLIAAQANESINNDMDFYGKASNSPAGSAVTIVNNSSAEITTVTFSNAICKDGRKRNGAITVDYSMSSTVTNATEFRQSGFKAEINFVNYTVDDWILSRNGGDKFVITNLAPAAYVPSLTVLSWNVDAHIGLTKVITQTVSLQLTWKDTRKMSLSNSTSSVVLANNASPIDWDFANIQWYGSQTDPNAKINFITGKTGQAENYTTVIPDLDGWRFTKSAFCTPMGTAFQGTTSATPVFYEEYHPFTTGMMRLQVGTIGIKDERRVDLGPGLCDNKGVITIRGITYPLDLRD